MDETSDYRKLDWDVDYDEFDNSIWEANSLYHDDGSPFKFRIKQRLESDKIVFYCDSDDECVGDGKGETWPTLEAAKEAMQKANDAIDIEIDNAAVYLGED